MKRDHDHRNAIDWLKDLRREDGGRPFFGVQFQKDGSFAFHSDIGPGFRTFRDAGLKEILEETLEWHREIGTRYEVKA